MPFREASVEQQRAEFVELAGGGAVSVAEACRRFGISRQTGYRWLGRAAAGEGLGDRPSRPRASPHRTPPAVEAAILALRAEHPTWGAAKLRAALARRGVAVPAVSTVHVVLARGGALSRERPQTGRWTRFEREAPNELWQIDFMGHRALAPGAGRVHPLAVIDDHSRYALALAACADQRRETVRAVLEAAFRRHGLPWAVLADNGPPWGSSGAGGVTALEAWLIRLGVAPRHGRAYHPQTQGKVERFHGTVAAEAFGPAPFADLAAAQRAFDRFRGAYNRERPHQALGFEPPAARWRASPRPFPEREPRPEYGPDDEVRLVRGQGAISFRGRPWFVGRGLAGEPVAVRPTAADGVFAVVYCLTRVATIDLVRGTVAGRGVTQVAE